MGFGAGGDVAPDGVVEHERPLRDEGRDLGDAAAPHLTEVDVVDEHGPRVGVDELAEQVRQDLPPPFGPDERMVDLAGTRPRVIPTTAGLMPGSPTSVSISQA